MTEVERIRVKHLLENIPDILECKSLLYIGARPDRIQCLPLFLEKVENLHLDIVEAHGPYAEWAKTIEGVGTVHNMEIQKFFPRRKYDCVMWWHGPEHAKWNELPPVFRMLELASSRYVVMGCPFGINESKGTEENPYTAHLTHLTPEHFGDYGYNVSTIGEINVPWSHILVWKRVR